MLFSENYHQQQPRTTFENADHLQNNSISSSVSSSSSATNSSIGTPKDPMLANGTAFKFVKQRNSASPTTPSSSKSYKMTSIQATKLSRHSSMLNNRTDDSSLSDRLFGNQLKINNSPSSSSRNKKSNEHVNKSLSGVTKSSYTFKQHDPNRMSCYDNDNELLNGYLAACNTNPQQLSKSEYQNSQSIIIPVSEKDVNANEFSEQSGIVPAYAKRYHRGSLKKGSSKEMSTSCLDKSDTSTINHRQISGSTLDLSTNRKNRYHNNERTFLTKTASNSNLFARALNYAFKKTGHKAQPEAANNDGNGTLTATWKSKLGKYLSSTTGLNLKSAKSQNLEACNLDMEDDFTATYHLSRRNPVTGQSKKSSTNCNSTQFNLNGAANNRSQPIGTLNNSNQQQQANPTQLFLCLSSSSSSSGSNNSTSLSTPASFEAQNILTTLGTTSTSKENQHQQIVVNNNNINNLSYPIPITTEEPQSQQKTSKPQEMKRSLSKSKSNSQKISDLAACVGYANNSSKQSDSRKLTSDQKSNTANRKLINNGFNSLRRMLKMSTATSQEPLGTQNQTKTLGSSPSSSSKKNRNKCLSASATPLPSCLAPQRQFNNADSYTESQNSAYSSAKPKPKDTKKYKKSSMLLSHTNIAASKQSLNRQSMCSLNSAPSTPKSSKLSTSMNPSHFTKSIVNQTNSSFSSSSLNSSTNFTPELTKPQDQQNSPNKHSFDSIEPINQSVSHTSLNTKPFQSISHSPQHQQNHSPNKKSHHYHTITSNHLSKKHQNHNYHLGSANQSLKPRKEYKSEKSVLPRDNDDNTEEANSATAASNQKKMINMLKVYKNVLNKMQKGNSNNTSDTSLTTLNTTTTSTVTKAFQPPAKKTANIQKRYSDEIALKQARQQPNQQQLSSFSANKVNKKSAFNASSTSGIKAKTSPIKQIVTYSNTEATNDNENKQIVLATAGNLHNSLKNVNKKARRLKEKLSPEEEFMCDQEVASYFEPIPYSSHADSNMYDCEDVYYFEEALAEPSKFKGPADSTGYVLEEHSLEDDSKNLEVLVRQLAAEAALSTLSENKLTKDSEADYMKSFTDIFGKVNEKVLPTNGFLYKNKGFSNYESPKSMKLKSNKGNQQKYYSDEDKRLVYDLIENEFGLSEDDYNLLKQIQNEQNHNTISNDIMDNESLSDEYLNRHSSESISPSNFNHRKNSNHMQSQHRYQYEDDVQSLFKSNTNNNNVYSSYEVDNIENWLDSISNLKIQPSKSASNHNSFKNGFLSLKVKPQRNTQRVSRNTFQHPSDQQLQPKKRSSSSTSFQPACNYLQIVEKSPQVPTRTNSITIDINDNSSLSSKMADRSMNSFNNSNPHIKIEKKIRLNYQRPHDPNSILNFGTLC